MQLLKESKIDRQAGGIAKCTSRCGAHRCWSGRGQSQGVPPHSVTATAADYWRTGTACLATRRPRCTGARLAWRRHAHTLERALAMEPNTPRACRHDRTITRLWRARIQGSREEFTRAESFLIRRLAADDKCCRRFVASGCDGTLLFDTIFPPRRATSSALELDPNEAEALGFQSIVLKFSAVQTRRWSRRVRQPSAPGRATP